MRTERSVLRYAAVLVLGLALGTALHWQPPAVHATAGRIGIRHRFVSPRSDGTDPTQVQPSHWNDEHVLDAIPFGAMAAPTAPIDGDCWAQDDPGPPEIASIKCRLHGVNRTMTSITLP